VILGRFENAHDPTFRWMQTNREIPELHPRRHLTTFEGVYVVDAADESSLLVSGGHVHTPEDGEPSVDITQEVYPLDTDTYVYLTADLSKLTGIWTVTDEMQNAASAPDYWEEDEDSISVNHTLGHIYDGRWYEFNSGDWEIPPSIFQAAGYAADEVQFAGHDADGDRVWVTARLCPESS